MTYSNANNVISQDSTQIAINDIATDNLCDATCGSETKFATTPIQTISVRKKALFIPASIRSHIIPMLYVADLLADEYDIHYTVTNQVLADIVTENGYTSIMSDSFRVAVGMEHDFLLSKKKKTNFWSILRSVYANDLYYYRERVLDELMARVQPDVVIIDVFSSTDFLFLHKYRSTVRLLFCNPMLSTYRIGSLPTVSEGIWSTRIVPKKNPKTFSINKFFKNPRDELHQAALRVQWKKIQHIAKLSEKHKAIETPYTLLFTNVPELLLAPLELELTPDVKQSNQYYLGLCIREQRTDTELDSEFSQKWPIILASKQLGDRLIYCSFGTFYTGSDKALLDFVTNLLEAVAEIANVQMICSVNHLVIETLKTRQASSTNIHFFKRVPQLEVLKAVDVHITHGGLGSIKESIKYGVPMLVYPLDLHYDQNGNGLKVEQHGLGLRGVFNWERTTTMRDKITRLLDDDTFRTNVYSFRDMCATQSTTNDVQNKLTELLTLSMS